MKAAVRRNYGAFADLRVEEIPVPMPRETEVLIKVIATTVNRTDCAILTGKPLVMRLVVGLLKPRRPVPGSDFSGVIEQVGPQAGDWQVGERVFGFADEGLSSQATYMVFPGKGTMGRIPEGIPYHIAAASLEGAHYAYNFLNKIQIQAGQKVMLNGATGAIGSAMLQFLKIRGVSVTATCGTGNEALVLGMGADRVIDYMKEDFCQDKEKYDFVLDAVGKSRFRKCRPLLKPTGVYISSELGPYWENIYLPLTTKLFGKQRVVFPIPSKIRETIGFVQGLLGKGDFKPLIDPKIYGLDDIASAYEYAASGKKLGNIVVEIQDFPSK